jgi:hypothetical protein
MGIGICCKEMGPRRRLPGTCLKLQGARTVTGNGKSGEYGTWNLKPETSDLNQSFTLNPL